MSLRRLVSALILVYAVILLVAVPVLAAYSANILVREWNGTAYGMYPFQTPIDTPTLVGSSYITATGLDTRVSAGGTDYPHTLADDKLLWADSLPASSSKTFQFTTGNIALTAFYNIFGRGGYVTTADVPALEWGAAGNVTMRGYIDTSAAMVGNNILLKTNSMYIRVTAVGQVTAYLYGTTGHTETLYPNGPGDLTNIPNLVGAATHWQANLTNDGDTSYVMANAGGNPHIDTYNMDDGTVPAGATINSVVVHTLARQTGVFGSLYNTVRLGGVNVQGPNHAPLSNPAYTDYSDSLARPGGGAWTPADIPNLQAGPDLGVGGAVEARNTQTYVVVTYKLPDSAAVLNGITSGVHTISASLTAAGWTLTIDGVSNTVASTILGLEPTANDWIWMANNVVPYAEYMKMCVGAAEVLWYQPASYIVGTVLPDRDGADQNGVITWGSNAAGVQIIMDSLLPSGTTTASTGTTLVMPGAGPESNLPSDWVRQDTEMTGANIPWLYPIASQMANDTNTPIQFFWWLSAAAFVMVVIAYSYKYLRNMFITGIATIAAFALCVAMAFLPSWVIFVTLLVVVGVVLMEREPSI